MSSFFAIIAALPEAIKLIRAVERRLAEAEKKKTAAEKAAKLKEDIRKINEAFDKQDIDLLNDVFSR